MTIYRLSPTMGLKEDITNKAQGSFLDFQVRFSEKRDEFPVPYQRP